MTTPGDVLGRLSRLAGAWEVAVLALEVGMVVALPCREKWLPWQVVGQVDQFGELPLVQIPLRRTGVLGSAMQRLVAAQEKVLVVSRHHGVCVRCGGLAPCADELVERELRVRVEADDLAWQQPGFESEASA